MLRLYSKPTEEDPIDVSGVAGATLTLNRNAYNSSKPSLTKVYWVSTTQVNW